MKLVSALKRNARRDGLTAIVTTVRKSDNRLDLLNARIRDLKLLLDGEEMIRLEGHNDFSEKVAFLFREYYICVDGEWRGNVGDCQPEHIFEPFGDGSLYLVDEERILRDGARMSSGEGCLELFVVRKMDGVKVFGPMLVNEIREVMPAGEADGIVAYQDAGRTKKCVFDSYHHWICINGHWVNNEKPLPHVQQSVHRNKDAVEHRTLCLLSGDIEHAGKYGEAYAAGMPHDCTHSAAGMPLDVNVGALGVDCSHPEELRSDSKTDNVSVDDKNHGETLIPDECGSVKDPLTDALKIIKNECEKHSSNNGGCFACPLSPDGECCGVKGVPSVWKVLKKKREVAVQ